LEELNKNNLHSFPEINNLQILQLFEDWIFLISKYYSQKNTIQPYELEDLQQFIRTRLIEQLPKIRDSFKGESKLRTYISAIILNLCREFRKKNCSKSILTQAEVSEKIDYQYNNLNQAENNIAIEYEVGNLNKIILMYGTKSVKVKLALKLYYSLKITREEISNYCKDFEVISSDLEKEIEEKKQLKKKEALIILTELFNRTECKSNSTEATRKWISRLIDEILIILNKGKSNHTKETLGLLLEKSQSK
jgi:hypothetical protein